MAGDWIKMRTSLLTNPKVNGIARALEGSTEVTGALSTGFGGPMCEIVTRNVMRHVTVSSLLVIWGAANEHTRDGIFVNADLSDVDDMVGIPGFGAAMESVGWLHYDAEIHSVTLPNFNEYNTSGSTRSADAKTSARRQKEYRERKKAAEVTQESDVTRDVTNDVTSNRREEKRREEKNSPSLRSGESAQKRAARKCPETFAVTDALREWAAEKHPGLDARGETAKFRDHTFKNPISDWDGAWRNWIRKADEYSASHPGKSGPVTFADKARERMDALTGRTPAVATKHMGELFDVAKHLGN
jgi:hypothetical protein